jgi:NADH:ubiquinone oxidoreductase subunit 5 (subunit L)/multisubunit Na+/H+ antiporter MnhA subunit
MIWKILTATAMTVIAFTTNFYIGQIWVREGLDADKFDTSQPMQPHEIILFAISGLIFVAVPSYTAAWLANSPRWSQARSADPEVQLSTWMSLRVGKNPPLTAAVLTGCVALAILVYGPGLLSLLFG